MRDRLSRSRNTSRASYVRLLQIVGGWNAPEHKIPMAGQNLKSLFNGTPSSSRLSFQTSGPAVLSAQRIGMAAERTARRLLFKGVASPLGFPNPWHLRHRHYG